MFVLLMMKSLRGWEFDELEEKLSPTEKPNSYPFIVITIKRGILYHTHNDSFLLYKQQKSLKTISVEISYR